MVDANLNVTISYTQYQNKYMLGKMNEFYLIVVPVFFQFDLEHYKVVSISLSISDHF